MPFLFLGVLPGTHARFNRASRVRSVCILWLLRGRGGGLCTPGEGQAEESRGLEMEGLKATGDFTGIGAGRSLPPVTACSLGVVCRVAGWVPWVGTSCGLNSYLPTYLPRPGCQGVAAR